MGEPRSKAAIFVGLAVGALLTTASSLAHATAYSCDLPGVNAAFAAGGTATFGCAQATTVTLSAPAMPGAPNLTLDGGGLLTLDGGGNLTPIHVLPGHTVALQRITINHGFSGGYGSSLYVEAGATVTLTNSVIENGQDGAGGAIYVENGGTFTMTGSSLIGNQDGPEGAIAAHGSVTITSSTIDGANTHAVSARAGGTVTATYSTLVSTGGETFFVLDNAGTSITVGSSLIIAPPGQPNVALLNGAPMLVSQGYNIATGATSPFAALMTGDQINTLPRLTPIGDNGGLTPTRALLPCSPGINAGATTGGPATDQTGFTRRQNGAIDVGAVESSYATCVSVGNASQPEGNVGQTPMYFPVSISGLSSLPITVAYSFTDGTATTADDDYTASPGSFTIPPFSEPTGTEIEALINGDTKYEPDENFFVNLGVITNGTVGTGLGTGTIQNDDLPLADGGADADAGSDAGSTGDAGSDAGSTGDAGSDAGSTTDDGGSNGDAGTTNDDDAGSTTADGGSSTTAADASSVSTSGGPGVSIGVDSGTGITAGGDNSDDSCTVTVLGTNVGSHAGALIGAPLALLLAALRRRRRR